MDNNIEFEYEQRDMWRCAWIRYKEPEITQREIANFIGVKHCVTTNSCTTALILAIDSLNIKEGNALIPSFTFPATAHAVSWSNLQLKPIECDRNTFNINVEDLQEKIDQNTKLIIGVHVFGNPCDLEPIERIAD